MRDRLIELIKDIAPDLVAKCGDECDKCTHGDCVGKLADHLLNSGIIAPPCKVGQTVYSLATGDTILQGNVERFAFNKDNRFCIDIAFENGFVWRYFPEHFGKTIFFTKEEAERALERREG